MICEGDGRTKSNSSNDRCEQLVEMAEEIFSRKIMARKRIRSRVRADFEAKIGDIIARKRGGRGARGRTILVGG